MSAPIDDEVYGDKGSTDPAATKQGNPGRPQYELNAPPADEAEDSRDPRDTDHPAADEHAAENIENEPAG